MITAEWFSEHDACEPGVSWWHEHGEIADVDACIQALADDRNEGWVMWLAAEAGWTGYVVTTCPDGSRCEEWYRDGKRHREDGPACVTTHSNGSRWES